MAEPIYLLNDLRQAYGGREVLHVDKLQIWRGEILALVGPSGAARVLCCAC